MTTTPRYEYRKAHYNQVTFYVRLTIAIGQKVEIVAIDDISGKVDILHGTYYYDERAAEFELTLKESAAPYGNWYFKNDKGSESNEREFLTAMEFI